MKTKKNKKYYNFTEKQRRSDYVPKRRHSGAPSSFVRIYNVNIRRDSKITLKKHIINSGGYPTIYDDIIYPMFVRNAGYYYW